VPLTVGLACWATAPLERRLADPFVRSAAERLARVGPTVVAITGSYGKTTTKGYVAHLLGTSRSVVASPASFNNRAGLARAVNEHLAVGTEVFVAEMGTYGPGEIAELCSWTRPAVAVITAIGPVHLERFGSEERIVEAKSEILAGARAIVLNVDDARLAAVAARAAGEGRRVWRCSGLDPSADVHVGVGGGEMAAGPPLAPCPPSGAAPEPGPVVTVRGRRLGCLAAGAPGAGSWAAPTNVACAVAVALELGVDPPEVARLLGSLPVAPNRLSVLTAGGGFTVLDDTYNSNPAGARLALAALEGAGTEGGRKVLVTPGMVELGRRQAAENEAFAAAARPVVTYLVVVGRTNRRALLLGIGAGDRASGDPAAEAAAGGRPGRRPQVEAVATREQAVAFVRAHLGPGDVVLYENDLPDHYP
ncbi:MAG: Mur ligase family protein, partial [Acidimicrobiales bacterium]